MRMTSIFSKLGGKKAPFRKTVELPKTAQDSIPFIEAYDNGLFLVDEDKYTLIFAFENIDYALIRDNEQLDVYNKYVRLLNSLPPDVEYQEFIMNAEIDTEMLEKALIPPTNNGSIDRALYQDYCKIMKTYIDETNDGSAKKIMLAALSFKPVNKFDNVKLLFSYYHELQQFFVMCKSDTHQLQPMEVFSLLHKFYHQFDTAEFLLPKNFLSRGHRIKDYIAPSMFNFKPREIEVGTAYTRVLFVKKYDRELNDSFIMDLLDNKEKICVSKHVIRMDKGKATEMIRKRVNELQARIQGRMERNHKTGGDFIPFTFREKLQELEDLQNNLSDTNCELFQVGIFVSVSAETKEDLDALTKYVQSKANQHQVVLDVLVGEQEDGLNTVLPFANNRFRTKNSSKFTHLLSDAAGVLIPFSTVDHFSQKGICYGVSINSLTKSIITLDRTEEMNSNGFTLGTSGSGKSMFTKAEIADVLMKYPNDEIIVIDPENEYLPLVKEYDGEILKLSPNSPTHFNVFDVDLSYSEEGANAVAVKSQFIMTIVETAKGFGLTSNEKSIIDRCVKQLYREFMASGGEKDMLPTLLDFYNMLLKQTEQEAHDIATCIELYATGSFNVFAHRTNVNINKHFLVIDIFEMGEQLRAVGLQVILEYLWQRVIENKEKGKRTWIWIDEFSYFFTDGEGKETTRSGDFFAKVYKRIRKHGGTVTGITQNITEVLESKQAQRMLGNSEFVVLLQQKKEDLVAVTKLFDLSDSQVSYLKTGEVGSGLIICGQKIIPFHKPIPQDSLLYKISTTKMSDKDKTEGD